MSFYTAQQKYGMGVMSPDPRWLLVYFSVYSTWINPLFSSFNCVSGLLCTPVAPLTMYRPDRV